MKHDTPFQHKKIFVNYEESGPKVYKSVFSQQVNMNGGKPIIIVNFNMCKSVLHNCNMKVHHIEHCQTKKKVMDVVIMVINVVVQLANLIKPPIKFPCLLCNLMDHQSVNGPRN